MRRRFFIGRRAIRAVGQRDRLALAEEWIVDRILEGRVNRRARGHDVQDRLVGVGGAGISRIVEIGAHGIEDSRADRSVRVAVLEAGEVAQLVRGDRGRKSNEVGARGRGLPGTAEEIVNVDTAMVGRDDCETRGRERRHARDVEIAPVDLGRNSPLEAD